MMAKQNHITVNEKFAYMDSKPYDNRHRVNLGSKLFKLYQKILHPSKIDSFLIFVSTSGDVLLRPAVNVPAREKWIHENPEAMQLFQQGIQDVIQGKVKTINDLNEFFTSL